MEVLITAAWAMEALPMAALVTPQAMPAVRDTQLVIPMATVTLANLDRAPKAAVLCPLVLLFVVSSLSQALAFATPTARPRETAARTTRISVAF